MSTGERVKAWLEEEGGGVPNLDVVVVVVVIGSDQVMTCLDMLMEGLLDVLWAIGCRPRHVRNVLKAHQLCNDERKLRVQRCLTDVMTALLKVTTLM